MARRQKKLLYGTLDILILKTVSFRPLHGYAIARWLEEASGNRIRVDESSLYPALYRLEERGHLTSTWGRSELDRRAKFYELTSAGRARLASETRAWHDFAEAVANVLGSREGPRWAAQED
jgi:PadR family transcriptional regulator PadR